MNGLNQGFKLNLNQFKIELTGLKKIETMAFYLKKDKLNRN
jgi:hypothetical protein